MEGSIANKPEQTPAPEAPSPKETQKTAAEVVKAESKQERKDLVEDAKEKAETGGFGEWMEDLWKTIKEKLGGVLDWFKGLFGKEKEELSPEETAKAETEAADFGDTSKPSETKDAPVDEKAEAKKREVETLTKIKGKEVKEGDKVDFTYYSDAAQAELKCTVDLADGSKPLFKLYNRNGSGVTYEMKLPMFAKIVGIDTTVLNVDRTGQIGLVTNLAGTKTVDVAKLFELLERMAANENGISLKAGNDEVKFIKKGGELKKGASKSTAEKPKETEAADKSWYEKLTDSAKKYWDMAKRVPELVGVYRTLSGDVDKIEGLIKEAGDTDDEAVRNSKLEEVRGVLGSMIVSFKTATIDGQLPRIFRRILERLKEQKVRIEALPGDGVISRLKTFIFNSDEGSSRDRLLANLDTAVETYTGVIDSEPGLYDDYLAVVSDYNNYKGELKAKAKAKGMEVLREKWQTSDPLFKALPDVMQKMIVEKAISEVI